MINLDSVLLLDAARAIVREAGHLMVSLAAKGFSVQEKSSRNFVTEVDLAVEKLVVDRLRLLTPDYFVVTEETESGPHDLENLTWVLDPVDGTTNLMREGRHSAVSLALVAKGSPVAGFIYNPYADELFEAVSGAGARLNGMAIHVSSRRQLDDCLVGFGTTPYDRRKAHQTFDLVEKVFMRSLEIRRTGSAALDLAYVACGRLDAFFEQHLQPWDYAAGSIICREAGGLATDWQAKAPDLLQGGSILASNGFIHDEILAILMESNPSD